MKKLRVSIPKKSRELVVLAQKILNKHQLDAQQSSLNSLIDESQSAKIASAMEVFQNALDQRLKSRQATQETRMLLSNIQDFVQNSRDVLSGVHKGEMKKLGEWGFTVLEPHHKAKEVKITSQKLIEA